jgi:hypothetical protein
VKLEKVINAGNPKRISRVDLSSRQLIFLAEELGFEIPNHVVASGDAPTR